MEDLKAKARKLGLWNMFLAKGHYKEGAGFSNVEYGLMCEYLGRSFLASEVCMQRRIPVDNFTSSHTLGDEQFGS